ncbi:uncharacterized protein LOC120104357 [Phoenix dactylifera]|uniref:Uncharacterized protein LOC120104357 n=1 Tax=Phoenix dactylifera TaxID=42345 RepID=A0A8B8ZIC5_PHODC|nr:uncharacterized protein LOC120104357 [Phoenix dactylifera]
MKNLSCLSCNSPPSHASAFDDEPYESPWWVRRCCGIEGSSWSGSLSPPPYAQLRSESVRAASREKKSGHRKMLSTGSPLTGDFDLHSPLGEPRLVRSGGLRRDWSFEDVRKQKAAIKDA